MKNKSFVGIDISKNVIDVSIFREDTNIKMFPHEVFNNSQGIWRYVLMAQKEPCGTFPSPVWHGIYRLLLLGLGKIPHVQELLFLYA